MDTGIALHILTAIVQYWLGLLGLLLPLWIAKRWIFDD